MNRQNINYKLEDIVNFPNLYDSFDLCLRGVRWKEHVIDAYNFRDYFVNGIYNDFYTIGIFILDNLYHTIINERGKERLVCSNTIRDRLVSKTFNLGFLLPCFGSRVIYDNSASQLGKGIDFALDRYEYFLHNAFLEWGTDFYILNLDIRHYFDSIPHEYIMYLINQFTTDYRILDYFQSNFNQFQDDPFINGGKHEPRGVGLGSECDQTFGIICLNEMDHIAKEQFKFKYYHRYMDDIRIIHHDKEFLLYAWDYFSKYVNGLGMTFNENKSNITHIKQTSSFLKIRFELESSGKIYRHVYKPNIYRSIKKINSLNDLVNAGIITFTDANTSFRSMMGSLQRSDSKDQIKRVTNKFDQLFIIDWLKSFPDCYPEIA